MISTIWEEVLRAARELNVDLQYLSPEDCERIRLDLIEKYTTCKGMRCPGWIWEYLKDEVNVNDSEAWQWIHEMNPGKKMVMLFHDNDEPGMLLFPDSNSVQQVISDCFLFEFYLTDMDTDYFISFNHHDVVSACGAAKTWLLMKLK